jgi:hypothetical protein
MIEGGEVDEIKKLGYDNLLGKRLIYLSWLVVCFQLHHRDGRRRMKGTEEVAIINA